MTAMIKRRRFLQLGLNTVGSATLLATLGGFERVLAATPANGDYRALVCVFLYGGCDTANLVIPNSSLQYAAYSALRSTMALPLLQLLPLNASLSLPLPGGASYALHPSCAGLQSLYNSGKLAVIGNVGPLVAPLTRADYVAGRAALPSQLFSHIDQQRQVMAGAAGTGITGWAGRIADLMATRASQPALAMNVSIGGSSVWQAGANTTAYALSSSGAVRMRYWEQGDPLAVQRRALFNQLLSMGAADSNLLLQQTTAIQRRAIDLSEQVASALSSVSTPVTFPTSSLGAQLAMVAKMIAARGTLGVKRQLFFVTQNGHDTHDHQLTTQTNLLGDLSSSLAAFQQATEAMGVSGNVTAFTASDFGRTLTSNGDGTDHGWGAQALVLGGAVNGGAIYGSMPSLISGGSDDAGAGRVIPSISSEQMAATLAQWFGLSSADVDTVFPTLNRFGSRNLGFMANG